jgi:hypothetical protein
MIKLNKLKYYNIKLNKIFSLKENLLFNFKFKKN